MTPEAAEALRAPFEPSQIGKLPRVTCRDCSDKKTTCQKHSKAKCPVCDAWISPAHIHLDYVGHAHVTDRLLQVDPEWSWEPVTFDADGVPLIQYANGEATMWIRLTVVGTTRLGVGIAGSGSFELQKQLISDALRNGAMRFGVALDLWAKETVVHDEPPTAPEMATVGQRKEVLDRLSSLGRYPLTWIEENLPDRKNMNILTAEDYKVAVTLLEIAEKDGDVEEAAAEFVGPGDQGGHSEATPGPDDLLAFTDAPFEPVAE